MEIGERVRTLYPRLIAGDVGVVGDFSDKATVDSPLGGRQQPPEFVAEERAWLERHKARVEDVMLTETLGRVAYEFVLCVDVDGTDRELPVLLVADAQDGLIRDLRVYHSTWPLSGAHSVRHPIMQYAITEEPAEPVGTYHQALGAGDAAAADGVFEPDGYVREPAGGEYRYTGEARAAWYRTILSQGGIPLQLGTITDDGVTLVYEYCVDQWGTELISPQAGAAAYTRGASGKLSGARIYDDVTPPAGLG